MIFSEVILKSEVWQSYTQTLRFSVDSGSSIIIKGNGPVLEIKCENMAFAFWSIYKNKNYFKHAFNLTAHHSEDIDGGGRQMLTLYKGDMVKNGEIQKFQVGVIFSPARTNDWLYEATLWQDGRKDYEPSRDMGKHKFSVSEVIIDVFSSEDLLKWINESYFPWIQKLSRIFKPHSDLNEWVKSDLDMEVRCLSPNCANRINIFNKKYLSELIQSGVTLESLRKRLSCSKCGNRNAKIIPS